MSLSHLLDQALELKWLRALDVQFARMVATEDNPALMLAAALLSHDAGEGHVCLPLSRLRADDLFSGRAPELARALLTAAGDPQDWASALLSSSAVSCDDSATPIKLIGNRLYLNRMWRNEQQVADFFGIHNHAVGRDEEQVRTILDTLFGVKTETDWQKVAAAVALTRRISVISGGPGTGKTTTVAKLLVALVQLAGDKPLRIQLTAPTGKAAARLTESLGRSLRDLQLNESDKKRLPEDACTLHRLLGAQRNSQNFRYHAGNPLHLDVLVVDEASMVDLPMMSRLIAALPGHSQVIFLGDRDQLASVEAGAVLGDICHYVNPGYSVGRASQLQRLTGCAVPSAATVREGGLADCLCLLRKSYRFDNHSGIGQLARAVNSSDTKSMTAILADGYQDLAWRQLRATEDYAQMIEEMVAGYRDYLRQVHDRAKPGDIIHAFGRYQVLCALRSGPFGVAGLNERIERWLASARLITLPTKGASRWYHGRPVMIARNEGALGLFNGDIGIALQHQDGLRVWFPMPDGSVKSFQPARLPQHDTAWAMTVHKSQGSEFDHAALVLPNQFTPVLTRELVYTAITRAKQHLSLYADKQLLYKAVATRTERRSGLMAIFASSMTE